MPLSSSSCCSGAESRSSPTGSGFRRWVIETIFSVTLLNQLKVGAFFGVAFFIIFYLNLYLATRFSSQGYWVDRDDLIHIPPWESGTQPIGTLVLLASLLFSLFAALRGSAQWENYLRFLYGTPFGTADPLFNRDIGFYVFQLPFLKHLYGWLMTVLIITILGTGVVYFIRRSFQFIPPQTLRIAPAPRKHLIVLAACLFFVGTWGAWIALYEMLYSKRGVVFGPGYTDVNTQLLMLKILIVVTAFCGLTILSVLFRRDWRVPAVGVGAFLAVLIIGTGNLPVPRPEIQSNPGRDRPGEALPGKEHPVHPYGLRVELHQGPGIPRRGHPDPGRPAPQRADHQEHPPVGPCSAPRHLQPAPGNPHLLQVHRRGQRPVHHQRRTPAGHALRPGTLLPGPALPHLGQRTPDVHPRVWRRPRPRQPDFAGGASRILHQGHSSRLFGRNQDHPAGDLLRGDFQRVRLRPRRNGRSSITLWAKKMFTPSTREKAACLFPS